MIPTLIGRLAPFRYLILAAVLFGAGWLINGWRLNAEIAEIKATNAGVAKEFEKAARVKEAALNLKLQEAQNAAKKRETILRNDADIAVRTSDRLRDELAELRRGLPDLSADAIRQRADTLAQLLNDCQRNYRGLAEKADRIESDRRTLMEAWPK